MKNCFVRNTRAAKDGYTKCPKCKRHTVEIKDFETGDVVKCDNCSELFILILISNGNKIIVANKQRTIGVRRRVVQIRRRIVGGFRDATRYIRKRVKG